MRERGSLSAGRGPASLEASRALQIMLAHGHRGGSNPGTSCELRAWGPYGRWERRSLPSSPAA